MNDKEKDDEEPSEEELLEMAETDNWLEESLLFELVKLSNKHQFSNFFNSFDWVNDFSTRINDPLHPLSIAEIANTLGIYHGEDEPDYPDTGPNSIGLEEISHLESQWQRLGFQDERIEKYEKHYRQENPLELFILYVQNGIYPPPELLVMVVKCFNLYFKAKGKLNLENVFFGQVKKRAGNYAARKAQSASYKEFHRSVISEKASKGKEFNLHEFTLHMINVSKQYEFSPFPTNPDSIESYIRGYQRWKKYNPD